LTIQITGTNDAPTAVGDTNSVTEGTDASPTVLSSDSTSNVLTNDTDPDHSHVLSVTAVNGAAGNVGATVAGTFGTLNLGSDGSYTYNLDNADTDTNALAQGETANETFAY